MIFLNIVREFRQVYLFLRADTFSPEPSGHQFENYVLTELLKLGHRPRYRRSRGGAGVDLVVGTDGGVVPIEVKLRADSGRTTRGLRSFLSTYRPGQAFVVGYRAEEGESVLSDTTVAFTDIAGLTRGLGRARP